MSYKINTDYSWLKLNNSFEFKINLITDSKIILPKDSINIVILCEPQSTSFNKEFFITNQNHYDFILTHDYEVLSRCKNALFFEFGTCWVCDFIAPHNKKFEVSFLVGSKSFTTGHKLRHTIWNNQDKISIPKNFYNSKNSPYYTEIPHKLLLGSKNELFNSQFHICIENSDNPGYFSEKLIDCLYTKTIPIYYGCRDIHRWFNMDSIFRINSLDDIIRVCNNINETTYEKYIESINDNYNRCLKFLDYESRVIEKINEIIRYIKNENISNRF